MWLFFHGPQEFVYSSVMATQLDSSILVGGLGGLFVGHTVVWGEYIKDPIVREGAQAMKGGAICSRCRLNEPPAQGPRGMYGDKPTVKVLNKNNQHIGTLSPM